MSEILRGSVYIIKTVLLAGFITVLIHYFVVQPYVVSDNNLTPLYNKGEVILISRIAYFNSLFHRNDIVVYREQKDLSTKKISRILALPGEIIAVNDGILSVVGDERITKDIPLFDSVSASLNKIGRLDSQEFFILGNQGLNSEEGLLDIKNIIGKPIFRIWPLNKFGRLH